MRALEVVAGPHDDVEARAPGDAGKRQWVAADAEAGRVDDGVAAEIGEAVELPHGEVDVEQEAIVPVEKRVHAEFADDLRRDRLLRDGDVGGAAGPFPPG